MNIEKERAIFEAHTLKLAEKSGWPEEKLIDRKPSGAYLDKLVHAAWMGWQAAVEKKEVELRDLKELLSDCYAWRNTEMPIALEERIDAVIVGEPDNG